MKIYYIDINDDDCYMNAVSLVELPAVEHNFLKFDAEKVLQLQFANEDEHIITGVVCLADTPIYRRDAIRGEYYIVFTKDVIKQMVEKYSKMNLFNSVNLDHDDNKFVDNVIMVETFIKDSANGIDPIHFKDVPEGSLFMSYKVTDDKLWDEIKNGDHFKGFSLQINAMLDEAPAKDEFEAFIDELLK